MGARLLSFPATRRVRPTPVELRLSVLSMLERELRRAQEDEQRRGEFTPCLSLALDWLDILDQWETAA
jgi:hypothetical protein